MEHSTLYHLPRDGDPLHPVFVHSVFSVHPKHFATLTEAHRYLASLEAVYRDAYGTRDECEDVGWYPDVFAMEKYKNGFGFVVCSPRQLWQLLQTSHPAEWRWHEILVTDRPIKPVFDIEVYPSTNPRFEKKGLVLNYIVWELMYFIRDEFGYPIEREHICVFDSSRKGKHSFHVVINAPGLMVDSTASMCALMRRFFKYTVDRGHGDLLWVNSKEGAQDCMIDSSVYNKNHNLRAPYQRKLEIKPGDNGPAHLLPLGQTREMVFGFGDISHIPVGWARGENEAFAAVDLQVSRASPSYDWFVKGLARMPWGEYPAVPLHVLETDGSEPRVSKAHRVEDIKEKQAGVDFTELHTGEALLAIQDIWASITKFLAEYFEMEVRMNKFNPDNCSIFFANLKTNCPVKARWSTLSPADPNFCKHSKNHPYGTCFLENKQLVLMCGNSDCQTWRKQNRAWPRIDLPSEIASKIDVYLTRHWYKDERTYQYLFGIDKITVKRYKASE